MFSIRTCVTRKPYSPVECYSDHVPIQIKAYLLMSNPGIPEPESTESFDQIFSQYEQDQSQKARDRGQQIEGTVIALTTDSVLLDIGFKSEGVLPLSLFQSTGETVQPGDKM